LVLTPANTRSIKQVHNRLHGAIDLTEVVTRESMRAASDGGDVVRLTGVSDGFVVGKGDAFAGNPIKICY
jgi:hypothetical protein